jgi:hypothetical protein
MKITINTNTEEKKLSNHSNFGQFDRLDDSTLTQLVEKAMKDNHGNKKGFFTKDDWVFICLMWPNLHWTEYQASQVLHALLEKGMIVEMGGPGLNKFGPTEKLSFE